MTVANTKLITNLSIKIMFIGDKEIKMTTEKDEKTIVVEFATDPAVTINKELFDLIKSEEKGNGNVTDNVNAYFSRKFLAELAYYNLDYYFAGSVGIAMETLSHNLREELFAKTFACSGANDIKITKLLGVDTIIEK